MTEKLKAEKAIELYGTVTKDPIVFEQSMAGHPFKHFIYDSNYNFLFSKILVEGHLMFGDIDDVFINDKLHNEFVEDHYKPVVNDDQFFERVYKKYKYLLKKEKLKDLGSDEDIKKRLKSLKVFQPNLKDFKGFINYILRR